MVILLASTFGCSGPDGVFLAVAEDPNQQCKITTVGCAVNRYRFVSVETARCVVNLQDGCLKLNDVDFEFEAGHI